MEKLSVKLTVSTPTSRLHYLLFLYRMVTESGVEGVGVKVYLTDTDAVNQFGGPIFSYDYLISAVGGYVGGLRKALTDFGVEIPRLIEEYENISRKHSPFATSGYGHNY